MSDSFAPMQVITSENNPKVKAAKKLLRKKGRLQAQRCLLEGTRLVEDAILSQAEMDTVFVSEELVGTDGGEEFIQRLKASRPKVQWYQVPREIIAALSETKTPQGVVAVAKIPEGSLRQALEGPNPLVLIADQVRDPGNLGTMIRTAAGAGCTGVVMTKGTVDPFSGKVLRSTMGSLWRIPIAYDIEYEELLEQLQQVGCSLVVADAQGRVPYFASDFTGSCGIVIGNEAKGPSPLLNHRAEAVVSIPLHHNVESLNAAVAAAVLLFEAAKQRQIKTQ
ncbi:MAG: RNA methyltransferase [Firmicutes bacterium]|nr:RNA methyltransferase [Bacillota bacterium]